MIEMIRSVYLLTTATLISFSALAQNSSQYFKVFPETMEGVPSWAQVMYGENPNVYEVEQMRDAYYAENTYKKDIHERNFKHWMMTVEPLLDSRGNIVWDRFENSQQYTERGNAIWVPIGPMETLSLGSEDNIPVSWQCNAFCFDQCTSSPDVLMAGIEGGDLFKSTDKGLNWFPVTEGLSVSTPTAVKIAPSNPDIAFFFANGSLYKTTDGGSNWIEAAQFSGGVYEIEINPTNPDQVYVVGQNGLRSSTDGGSFWITETTVTNWDLKFHPTNSSIIYRLEHNGTLNRADFYRSLDGGANWDNLQNGWYNPANPAQASDIGAKIGVTPADPDYVYVAMIGQSKPDDNGWIGVYKSENEGFTWTNPMGQDGGPYDGDIIQNLASFQRDGVGFHQGFYNFAFMVSHNDPEHFWVGALALTESTDGGQTVERIGGYYAQANGRPWVHPDIQDMHVTGNDIWIATDGGINYSNDEFLTHESRKNGIHNSTFWGYNQGWNSDVQVGGRYHNGNTGFYQTYTPGVHLRLGGAESPTGYVNPLHDRKTYFSDVTDRFIPETLDGPQTTFGNIGQYPNESYWTSESSEIEFDPRYGDHMYMGNANGIWKSVNGGGSFELLNSFGSGTTDVLEIEISRQNPDVLYCVARSANAVVHKTTDGGQNWTALPAPPNGHPSKMEIALNPGNDQELWAIEGNGTNVYRTTDGGGSWDLMTTPVINGHAMKDVQFQGGTGYVYFASNASAFHWDPNINDFVEWGGGLPARLSTYELRIFYKESTIRLVDKGKGIWEANLVDQSMPIAQPMTTSDRIFCSRDTVPFDCYSIVDHSGTSWNWTFNPQPDYVSATNVRNPRVVFGQNGSYDVTLSITDGNGNTSTQTVDDMVTVESNCDVDTVPGMNLETYADGDYATTADLGATTNTFTVTAWVKPNGIQPDYTGIVMGNGPDAAGLNFRGGNNMLGYHWPGGQWWWESGLVVPEDVWSYVAMVVEPTQITVYLDGVGSTHVTNPSATELSTMNIGSYRGWGSRNYSGNIEEVRIWNRSLSQDEIRELRHLTLSQDYLDNDPDVLAYYQFNESEGSALDRAGVKHATLNSNSARVLSTAAVGKGESDRLTVSTITSYDFQNCESSLLTAFSTSPEGEVVMSRINVLPDSLPNNSVNFGGYHVLNNYGVNADFGALISLVLKPEDFNPPADLVNGTSAAFLFQRSDNEDLNNWEQLCQATVVAQDGFSFDGSCSITHSGQFFVGTDIFNSIEVEEAEESLVEVYPNPTLRDGTIRVQNTTDSESRFYLFDRNGKLVMDKFIAASSLSEIPVPSSLSAGLYFYSVRSETLIENGKLVVN